MRKALLISAVLVLTASNLLASHLGEHFHEGSTSAVVARLQEVTVDPKTVVQAQNTDPNSVGVLKPVAAPHPGTWNYNTRAVTDRRKKLNSDGSYSTTVKDDGGVWTVTIAMQFPEGPVTDVWTLEKGTLVLRRESFKHFTLVDQKWKPVAIDLDFAGNKVTGTSRTANGQTTPVAVNLTGPISADATGSMVTIGCLPLVDGYSTTVRDWDIEHLKEKLWQLKVTGMERVTVPAGKFDAYKVALTSTDGSGDQETIWIAKDLRMPVKVSALDKLYGIIDTEMVP